MFAPINYAGVSPFNDWFVPDTTQRMPLGVEIDAYDNFWGYGVFKYVKSNDAILKGSICVVGTPPTYLATLTPNTANLGQPQYVACSPMASGAFGWVQCVGAAVIKTNATVAADAVLGLTAAGILGAAVTTKGLIGIHNVKSATATATVTAQTTNGTGILNTSGYDGFFVGMPLSGTGIPASTVVAKLSSDGQTIFTGSAIGTLGDKNSTATGSITLTGTYTGFGLAILQRPTGTYITA